MTPQVPLRWCATPSLRGTAGTAARVRRVRFCCSILLVCALYSCASAPIAPTPDMTRAEVAIAQAQKAGAGELANENLQDTQRKLDAAKAAASAGEGRRSQDLVEESMADAQLADLTAQSITTRKSATEIDKGIRALQSEANRRTPQ